MDEDCNFLLTLCFIVTFRQGWYDFIIENWVYVP